MKTIADGLQQDGDNFLLLRCLAAAMVIYYHATLTTGGGGPPDICLWLNWDESSGRIAVDFFFVTSGFLVTGSFLRRQHVVDFVWARFIRIVPAYTVCILLCTFVMGPLFTNMSFRDYFFDPGTYTYAANNLNLYMNSDLKWNLPGVFAGNPQTTMVNGSIWSLVIEVRMYLCAALLGLFGVLSRRWLFNIVLTWLLILGASHPESIPFLFLQQGYFAKISALFGLGAFCYVNRAWMPIHGGIVLALIALTYACRSTGRYPYLFAVSEVFFVFWFAYNIPWRGFDCFGDYSYGMYLWGYPAQQMLAAMFGGLTHLVNALFGLVIAGALGVASWHLVEKPALRLKGLPSKLMRKFRDGLATLAAE